MTPSGGNQCESDHAPWRSQRSAAGALALTGCSSSSGGGGTSSAPAAARPAAGGCGGGLVRQQRRRGGTQTYKLGFIGALSGAERPARHQREAGRCSSPSTRPTSSGKYNFKVQLDPQDSEGDPAQAPAAATALIYDPRSSASIGPAFSGESEAVDPSFCAATPPMPIVTASASKGTLQNQGYNCWHRIIPNDNVEGTQGADWLARTGAKKVFVLNDLSTYGPASRDDGHRAEGQGRPGHHRQCRRNHDQELRPDRPDDRRLAVPTRCSTAATTRRPRCSPRRCRRPASRAARSPGNGGKDSTFTKNAGPAGNGWYFTCGCQDATVAPSAKAFAAAYKAKFGEDPSTYSPEAYDAANLIMDAISKAQGTPVTRTSLLTALNAEDFQGITTTIKFQTNGEVVPNNLIVNLFQQKNGADRRPRRHQQAQRK